VGLRALGIAECFREGPGQISHLAGVVVRSDRVLDGMVFGQATLEGDDATDSIIDMYGRLSRSDINVIMIGGAVISLYNIIDPEQLFEATGSPTICVTFEESPGLEEHIRRRFPDSGERKLEAYRRLGGREPIMLRTGYTIYARAVGLSVASSKRLLDRFTLQGAVPEPIRLAKLLAKARLDGVS